MAQTALQELIEFIKNMEYHYSGLDNILSKATSLLPKERQDIQDSFVAGSERGTGEIPFNCEQYFNQTFNEK